MGEIAFYCRQDWKCLGYGVSRRSHPQLRSNTETLSQGDIKDPAKITSFARSILKHANRLSALVEDLLSSTRLESETSAPDKRDINFADVLDASILVVRPAAEEKRLRLDRKSVPEDLKVWADRDQLSQTLINLLDNSVKYTPEGGSVAVSIADMAQEIQVTVKDTGLGIPKKDLDRVFERFYRVDKNRSRDMGGTGLGLSIVKHIVQSLGQECIGRGIFLSFQSSEKRQRRGIG